MSDRLNLFLQCLLAVFLLSHNINGEKCHPSFRLPERCECSPESVQCLFADLTEIPPVVPEGINHLDLRYNRMSSIPIGVFSSAQRIDSLVLSNNNIKFLQADAFIGLANLKHLWLNSNGLEQISQYAFRGLLKLETLHLEYNQISSLHESTLAEIPNLQKLFLQHNKLSTLHRGLFSGASSLNQIRLDQNTFFCDCHILNLIEALQPLKNIGGHTATCSSPSSLSGRQILSITSSQLNCGHHQASPTSEEIIDAEIGQSLHLECQLTREPSSDIVWMHNQQELGSTDPRAHHRFMDDGSLQVDIMDSTMEGTYQCMAKARGQETTGPRFIVRNRRQHFPPIVLTNNQLRAGPPAFVKKPQDFEVKAGERIDLECEASGTPKPIITWRHDGNPIDSGRGGYRISSSGDLIIELPGQIHNGRYECVAANNHSTIRASARLRVRVKPVIIEAPQDSIAHIGGRMTLRCRADGYPTPHLAWLRNGAPTPTTFVHDISRDGTELLFLNVTMEDAATYKCFAQNSAGTASASALLTVREAVSDVPDQMDIRENIIPKLGMLVDQVRNTPVPGRHTTLPDESATRIPFFNVAAPTTTIRTPETDMLRSAFQMSLRIVDEKVERGFVYNESIPFENVLLVEQLSACRAHRRVVRNCSSCYHQKYRTFDGTCNNRKNPMQGASFTPLKRLLPPEYEDGFVQPIGSQPGKLYHGFSKPSARLVSSKVLSTINVTPDTRHSHMLMQWGQFLDHDLSFTLMELTNEMFPLHANCKELCSQKPPCFPIPVPTNDSRMGNETCLEFIRSRPICGSGRTSMLFGNLQPLEQINSLTSYIDGSMIYGSSEEVSYYIRDHTSRGLLRTSLPAPGTEMPLLPYNDPTTSPEEVDCKRTRYDERQFPCFTAGEIRVNEQLGLLSMHIVWLREHNRVAEKLGDINPHWSGEKVFQETRKIIAAQIQHITFDHWIPRVLGPVGLNLLGPYTGYKDDVDASIVNSFATAALRMGHSMIFPVLRRLNSSFHSIAEGDLQLHETFFAPHLVFDQGGVDPVLRGLFASPAKLLLKTELMNSELTEKLFGKSTKAHRVPIDLGAFNIQRGRDHGLPSYVSFRKHCNLAVPVTFQDLRTEMDPTQMRRLQDVYGHPGNIDLFAGAMSERPLPGAKIGGTFMCLLTEQFKKLRDGDRFWYEKAGEFSQEQLQEIKKASLAKILCENTDTIDKVQKDIFLLAEAQGGYSWCENLPVVDLNHWKECCEDCYLRRDGKVDYNARPRRELRDNGEVIQLRNQIADMERQLKVLRAGH